MNCSFENLTIGALATYAQFNVETIRLYHSKCIMHEPGRPQCSVRRYGAQDLGQVRFIKSAHRFGVRTDTLAGS